MTVRSIEDAYPLSQLQAGMLFHSDLQRDDAMYHDIVTQGIHLPFDPTILQQVVDELVAVHPVLRTSFHVNRLQRPLQVVHPKASLAVTVEDLRGLDADAAAHARTAWIEAEKERGFDWAQAPLLRLHVRHLADDHFELGLSFHHAMLDGWSLAQLVSELLRHYQSRRRGEGSAIVAPRARYRDYVALEQQAVSSDEAAEFWRRELQEFRYAALPRRGEASGQGVERVRVPLTTETQDGLRALARTLGVPLKSVLLAAHCAAVGVLSGEDDVLTGVVTNGRPESEDGERVLGLFLNTIPLRIPLGGQSWRQLVEQVFGRERSCWPHRRYPMPTMKQEQGRPLFECIFNYTHFHTYSRANDGRGAALRERGGFEHSNYPFVLQAGQSPGGDEIYVYVELDRERLDASEADRFATLYSGLLHQMARRPDARVRAEDRLADDERGRLLAGSGESTDYPAAATVPELFAEVATRRPEAVAVRTRDRSCTYGELARRSDRLASALGAAGVGPGDRVGVSMERSIELIEALLAVSKAGATYVPLDRTYPESRLRAMADDAGVCRMLCEPEDVERWRSMLGDVPVGTHASLVTAPEANGASLARRRPDSAAYVMYTSGSTGVPKGVIVPDRGIVRLVRDTNYVELTESDVVLQMAPVSFDASTFEIWGALLNGAELALATPGPVALDTLRRDLTEHRVSVLWLTAPLFHLVVDEALDALADVRTLLAGGDALSPDHVRRYLSRPGGGTLVNGYGPTEATTFSCCAVMERPGDDGSVPIGRPISNSTAYVLDAHLNLTPEGTAGELYVGGAGLADGYWRRPGRTAASFVPDPFSAEPGARLYRTGDRVRHRADGRLEFLGRIDGQMKIRGHRIEPGEVERTITAHPSVRTCAVAAVESEPGHKRLVVYVVPEPDRMMPTVGELQQFASEGLPEYMLPAAVVALDRLPTTVQGKVDRAALPSPDPEATEAEHVEPRTDVERTLARVWQDVLGVEKVGIRDNFFELGGDSILSIQVKAQAQDHGIDFELEELFEHQTVERLAAAASVDEGTATGSAGAIEPFALVSAEVRERLPDGVEDAYPVTHLQSGMLFHSALEGDVPVYHDIFHVELRGPFDSEALRSTLRELERAHPVLRTSFELGIAADPLQLVHRDVQVPVAIDDLRALTEPDRVDALAVWEEDEKRRGFDWKQPPLFRVAVHRLTDDVFRCSFSFHHALLDGWSLATLTAQLVEAYTHRLGRGGAPVPESSVGFRDYVALEQGAADDDGTERFWRECLDGVEPTRLPRTAAGGERAIFRASVEISPETASGLRALAREASVPLKSVLLAAHLHALGAISGAHEVTTGVVANGRPEADGADQLVGLFLNTVPLRLELSSASWRELVRDVFEHEQSYWPHRRYPMPLMKRWLGGGELFEAAFNYTHFHVLDDDGADSRAVRILGGGGFEYSNFAFVAQAGVRPDTGYPRLTLEAQAGLLAPSRVEAYARLYGRVLDAMARQPDRLRASLEPTERQERRRLLGIGGHPVTSPVDGGLERAFAAAAARHADRIALRQGHDTCTFRELDARSSAIAGALRRHGVGPGARVAVALRRSPELVELLVAIVKLGGAYVPLDSSYPEERLQGMAGDAGVALLVCDEGDRARWASMLGAGAVTSPQELELDGQGDAEPTKRPADAAAYVMFTSGSTGRPKAVVVPDRGVVRLVCGPSYVRLGPEDRVLQMAPVSFDASTFEIWGALLNGAELVLAPDGPTSLEGIGELVAGHGVTVAWLTAPLFHLMVDERPEGLRGLSTLLAGGDALSPAHVERYLAQPWSGELINGYGPTEATTFSCCAVLRDASDSGASVPIGRTVSGSTAYVLDERMELAPEGTPGELYVGGSGLAHGYAGRGGRTASSFVPDPFGEHPGGRLYRTGDRVRLLPDGQLEFLGRLDRQLKIRGFRIESGEVERVLAAHPSVVRSVVSAWEPEPGRKRLVAHVVADGTLPEPAELQRHVGERLPEYMVPAAFVELEALPLTPNGKIDLTRLPAPDRDVETGAYRPPATETERTLCAIWSEVLGVEQVGLDDNFFELGGDSILSIQVKAQAEERDLDFALEELFDLQTVGRLAAAIDAGESSVERSRGTVPFELVDGAVQARLPEAVEDAYPLGHTQVGMLFHSDVGRERSVYHDIVTHRMRLPWDESAWRSTWAALARRHPALRTEFALGGYGEPLQLVHREAVPELWTEDLRALEPDEQDAAIDRWMEAEKSRGFDGSEAPPFRIGVLRLDDATFECGYSFHHALLDGWSVATLTGELVESYRAELAGESGAVEELRAAYRDFIAMERDAADDGASGRYWADRLAGAEPCLLPREDVEGGTGVARLPVDLDAATVTGLKRIARDEGVPIKSVLLALHLRAQSIWTGRTDVVTGLVTNGRPESEDGERLLGLFLNTVPFRLSLDGGRWRELVRATFEREQEIWTHRRHPLPRIRQSAGEAAELECIFNYTHMRPYERTGLGEDAVVVSRGGFEHSNYPLVLQAIQMPGSGRIELVVEADRAVQSERQAERLVEIYLGLARAAAHSPGARYDLEAPLPAVDRRRVAERSGAGIAAPAGDVVERFSEVVRLHPEAVALRWDGGQQSYGELKHDGDARARGLRLRGIGAGDRVGVCLERSPELVRTLVAVLEAGAAYVPLDPDYPDERLGRMVDDADVGLVVVDGSTRERLASSLEAVELVDAETLATDDGESGCDVVRGADSAAYVMYTSGSTGRPKGVVVPDRGILRLVLRANYVELSPDDVVLQMAPASFDASTFEIWGALLHGATLAIAPPGRPSLETIADTVDSHRVSVAWLTAPLFHLMVDERPDGLRGLRVLLAGGDALSPSHVARYLERPGSGELVNGYGPTEATTFSCCHAMTDPLGDVDSVPIGVPVSASTAYVLDEHLNLAPVGTPGELYVGGAGLAHGYWRRPGRTAGCFVPDPFGSAPGGRLYATGDRARLLPDGRFEFLGRLDGQLKIRGFRIEAGEVERALQEHPIVRSAAVSAWESEPGRKRLVAHVVPANGSALDGAELQGFVAERLPGYMVPSAIVPLDVLPLTVNGKLDRRALPAPDAGAGERAFRAPSSELERLLAAVWAEVLGVDSVGLDDNFFELGGDSILSIQLKAQAQEHGLDFALEELFELQTVERLAAAIESGDTGSEETPTTEPFELIDTRVRERLPEGAVDAYPLGHTQAGMLFHSDYGRELSVYHDIVTHRIRLPWDESAWRTSWSRLARRHAILRTGIEMAGLGEPVQVVYRDAEPEVAVEDLRGLSETARTDRIERWMEEEKERGFDWSDAPVFRVRALRLDDATFECGYSFHHAILDGWSVATLTHELIELYRRELQGDGIEPEPLRASYRDFIALERRAMDSASSAEYWRARLSEVDPAGLPAHPSATDEGVERELVELPSEVAGGLRQVAHELGVPLKSVLLALHLRALSVLTGSRSVVTGVVTNGRPESEDGERLLGLFLNTVPCSLELNGGRWRELVRATFEREQASWPHRRYPMPLMKQGSGGVPSFEAIFNYTHMRPYADTVLGEDAVITARGGFEHSNYPFVLQAIQLPGHDDVQLVVEIDRQAVGRGRAARFARVYGELARSLTRELDGRYELATGLSVEELGAVTTSETEMREPRDDLATLFARTAREHAARPALRAAEWTLSYGELDRRSARLAGALRQAGVRPGDRVAVALPRSPGMIVTLVAIVRAGAAYVPLDGDYPHGRLVAMLEDSGASLLVCDGAERWQERPEGIRLETLSELLEASVVAPPDDGVRRRVDSAAYVMFTSGSTGRPKGVVVPDRGVVRLVRDTDYVRLGPSDVVLQMAPVSFDASTFEIWGALLNGAELVLAADGRSSLQEIGETIARHRVSVAWLTAPLFHLMVDENLDGLRGLRTLLAGGDALSPRHVARYLGQPWSGELVNGYGPTEATTFSCCAVLRAFADDGARVPIGAPIAHSTAYVLDPFGNPVPDGTAGELYVGGAGLADGYRGRPGRTARSFVPDPFSRTPGARLYRTGDRVRRRDDGRLEFLGRDDGQLKIRGHRIEAGEVERVLELHPSIRRAVVSARERESGSKQLVAHLIGEGTPAEVGELQSFVAEQLPEYMVPSAFVAIDSLPLTPNGKLDRRALPDPRPDGSVESGHVEPDTDTERRLAAIWAEALGVERVGLDDNFFELGGDSILSIQVKAQAQEAGLEFALEELFELQTVGRLAAAIDGGRSSSNVERRTVPMELVSEAVRAELPDGVEDAYPLGHTQRGMLFHSDLDRELSVYHDIVTHRLRMPWDADAWQRTWTRLARRHAVLRTSLEPGRYGEPLQLVHTDATPELQVEDLRGASPEARDRRIAAWMEEEKERGFDWTAPPVFRVGVLRLDDATFECGYSFHHAILDGWSVATLTRELIELYGAELAGGAPETSEPKSSFRDFIALERDAIESDDSARHWRDTLSELEPTPLPPTDAPRGSGVDRVRVDLSAETSEGLKRIARDEGVPIKTVLLALHLRVLGGWSGCEEVVTGVVTNGRPEAEDGDRLLGLFLNTIPLPARLAGGRWSELVRRVFEREQASWPHRRYPLSSIQQRRGGETLFESIFNYTHMRPYEESVSGEDAVVVSRGGFEHSNYPFILQAIQLPGSERLDLVVEVDRSALGVQVAERVASLYRRTADRWVADPDGRYETAHGLTDAELSDEQAHAGERSDYPSSADLSTLFREVVEQHPDAVALRSGQRVRSYAELASSVDRLASGLRRHGVGPGSRVGVALPRSIELIECLLAIVQAGAAYVPLDDDYPRERLEGMIEDAGVELVIGEAGCELGAPGSSRTVEALRAGGPTDTEHHRRRGPLSAAYVMYTSGSTGRPKGVVVPDRGIVRLVRSTHYVEIGAEDVVLQMAPASFDASTFEIWGALLNGAELAIAPPGRRSLSEIGELVAHHRVSVAWLTAPLFHLMVDQHPEGLRGLRTLLAGGDALSPSHVRRYLERPWAGTLVNGYGPTEATTFSCCAVLDRSEPISDRVPIGRPLSNSTAHVLDAHLQPVPAGSPGELYVGGAGLAHGYQGRPARTAAAFVPDPFATDPGARLYRTGDRVRRRSDGRLEFLGRADGQLKIRGHRVEAGEVEHTVAAHPDVVGCAVVAHESEPGHKQLVAYVVPRAGLERAELRTFVAERLPEPMVPSRFVELEALPLTINGKLDRRALPAPDTAISEATERRAPAGATETAIAAIWAEVLGVESIAADDNFFELGGDSILSIQVKAQAQEAGLEFGLEELFEHQTVARLAAAIDAGPGDVRPERQTAAFELVDAEVRAQLPESVEDAYPLSHTQAGMLFHSEVGRRDGIYHDIVTHRLRLPWDEAALRRTWKGLARRHPMLRTSFALVGFGEPLQLVHRGASPEVRTEDLRALSQPDQDARVADWIESEKRRGFDGQTEPPFRVALLRRSDDEIECGYSFHHAILDGWSVAMLTGELVDRYQSELTGDVPASSSRPLDGSYRDFIALERDAMGSETSAEHWRSLLAGSEATRVLRQPGADGRGVERIRVEIAETTSAGLRRAAKLSGATLKSVLLAVHLRALSILGGTDDVVTGLVTHGRPEAGDGERLLGLFLNTVPLRCDLSGGRWTELIAATFASEQQSWGHRRYPMPLMKSDRGGAPLFDALFNYTHMHAYGEAVRGEDAVIAGRGGFEHSNYPFILQAGTLPGSGELYLVVEADRAEFPIGQARAIASVYAELARHLATDPEARHDRCDGLSVSRRAATVGAAGERTDYPSESTVPALFASVAQERPGALALRAADGDRSYGELDRRTDRLARVLERLGVRPGARVAVSLPRSGRRVEVLLAVLKAGGAFVPLDRSYPEDRLRFMLADADVGWVICEQDELARWQGTVDRSRVLPLARLEAEPVDAAGPPGAVRTADSAAYVMYTSGSTGRPKGVVVPDRAIVRLVRDTHYVDLTPDDVVLQLAPVSFDASTFEIWGAWLNGATLAVARDGRLALEEIGEELSGFSVTVAWLTAPLFHLMVDERPELLRGVRALLAGGDALSPGHVQRYLDLPWSGTLINGYGPTEATTFSACAPLSRWDGTRSVPIGRAISNSTAYVLDSRMQLVPTGAPGELYVGGDGLAYGYWGRSARTAASFVPDPFGDVPGGRLYATGDQVRVLPDGRLEFLGRRDGQLKIRGFRIEASEVERALTEHPSVRRAAVCAWEPESGQKRLAAYVVLDGGAPAPGELQDWVAGRLPEYMTPNAVVAVEALPLTANGKLDRAALPSPEAGSETDETAYEEPCTPTERALAAIWSEVLGVESVGRGDNFFVLGGDSILSIQVKAHAQEAGLDFALEDLFEHQTVARLAEAIDHAETDDGTETGPIGPFELIDPELRAELPEGVEDAYPISRLQLGMIFHSEFAESSRLYHDIVTYRVPMRLDDSALRSVVDALGVRHAVLRTRFSLEEHGRPLQIVDRDARVEVRVSDLSGCPESEQREQLSAWLEAEHERGFVLDSGPWIRIQAHRLGESAFQLAISCHHAVLDGWSEASLATELLRRYEERLRGVEAEPPPLRAHYRDFVARELASLESEAARGFWETLAFDGEPSRVDPSYGAESVPEPDRLLEGRSAFHGHVDLPSATSRKLLEVARRHDVPLKTVLLAAHFKALAIATGGDRVMTGVAWHGRPAIADADRVLGVFLNTLPLALDVGGLTWERLVGRVFELERAVEPHRHFPLAEIVRAREGRPAFEVLFNYTHFRVYEEMGEAGRELDLGQRGGVAETSVPVCVNLQTDPRTGDCHGAISCRSDLYTAATTAALADLYALTLDAVARDASLTGVRRGVRAHGDAGRPSTSRPARPYVAPKDASERVLARIWSDLLRAEAVGTQDDFFELGGHSLVATQLTSRVRRLFKVEVKVGRVYQHPSVASYAASLRDDPEFGARIERTAELIEKVLGPSEPSEAEENP